MIRPALRSLWLVLATAAVASPALGSDEDFALAFPLDAPAGEPVFAVEIPADAYATLTTPDLADLVVVDAQGREQPISLHRPPPPPPPQAPDTFPLSMPIPVPGDSASAQGDFELHVRRDTEGSLTALDLRSRDGVATASTVWLIDAGPPARAGIDGLRLTPDDDADFRTLVDIEGSSDLVHWEVLQTALPLFRASSGERRIERLDLRFARTTHRYLALRPVAGEAALPAVAALEGLRRREADRPPLASTILDAVAVSEDGRSIEFGHIGPLPVQQAEVQLAGGDGILEYWIEEAIGERWQPIANGTAWRLAIGGETLEATPSPLWRTGLGRLRLQLAQAAPPPRLVLGYAPDRVIVMANGMPPFRLLAGSARQRHSPVAMEDTLAAIRLRQGEEWQPPSAAVGGAQTLAGAAALAPRADLGRWGLWAVLGLGALVVGVLAWRLMKAPLPEN